VCTYLVQATQDRQNKDQNAIKLSGLLEEVLGDVLLISGPTLYFFALRPGVFTTLKESSAANPQTNRVPVRL